MVAHQQNKRAIMCHFMQLGGVSTRLGCFMQLGGVLTRLGCLALYGGIGRELARTAL